jgi:hypothetical protein
MKKSKKKAKPVETSTLLALTRWTFIAEMNNEDDGDGNSRDGNSSPGGVSPATLESALDSVQSGYCPSPHDDLNMKSVEDEIETLIQVHGPDKELDELITDDDWDSYNAGLLIEQAEQGI